MALKDPTPWVQDLSFYMTDEELAGHDRGPGAAAAAGKFEGCGGPVGGGGGVLGGAFGAVTVRPFGGPSRSPCT